MYGILLYSSRVTTAALKICKLESVFYQKSNFQCILPISNEQDFFVKNNRLQEFSVESTKSFSYRPTSAASDADSYS